ncbi:MAG: O-antigen ligase family protein [Blastocatellia bacterium]
MTFPDSNRLTLFSVPGVVPSIIARLSIESLLILWLATTPLASFYLRFPQERSILTYDRAVFALIGLMLLMKWRRMAANHLDGFPTPSFLIATRFEVAWGLLAIVALVSAVVEANNFTYATKIAVDSFCLPLLAFHVARHHMDVRKRAGALALSLIWLAWFLFATGAFEFVTGVNLFPYKGSELLREGERRVNGPFAADSSYAIICLLIALFSLVMPRVLRLRFDTSGRLVYAGALATGVVAALLPLFRSVALALIICWAIVEIGLAKQRAAEGTDGDQENMDVSSVLPSSLRADSLTQTRLIVFVVLAVAVVVAQILPGTVRFESRLADPRNVYGRLATWQAGAELALENPLFGVGLTNYTDYYNQRYNPSGETEEFFLDTRAADSPHSNPLWIVAELGMIGSVLYLAANAYMLLLGYRALKKAGDERQRAAAIGYLALVLAYWIPGLTLASGSYSDLNLYFFFMLGALSNRPLRPDIERSISHGIRGDGH